MGSLDHIVGLLPDPKGDVLALLQAVLHQRVDIFHHTVGRIDVLHGIVDHWDDAAGLVINAFQVVGVS